MPVEDAPKRLAGGTGTVFDLAISAKHDKAWFVVSSGDRWTVTSLGAVAGVIKVREIDQQWVIVSWASTDAYAPLAELFDRQFRLTRADVWDQAGVAEFEDVNAAIRSEAQLHYPDGRSVPEFLLHIEGAEARFRWSDEPDD